jgi:hypothetical protein
LGAEHSHEKRDDIEQDFDSNAMWRGLNEMQPQVYR